MSSRRNPSPAAGAGLTGINAGNITGALGAAQLPASVLTNAQTGVVLSGAFAGDGSGLTGLAASQIASGTLNADRIPGLDGSKITSGILEDARLSTNIALLNTNAAFAGVVTADSFSGSGAGLTGISAGNINGTLSAGQLPASVLTNGGLGVTLSGTFSGDGSGLTGVPGTVPWQAVAGTTQAGQANTAYLLTNEAVSIVNLPPTANVGDVVTVAGAGAGGWEIHPESGQTVLGGLALPAGITWDARDSTRAWRAAASSADGTKLVAAVYGGQIYTSTDSGVTWTARESNRGWVSVASSDDGSKLVAAVYGGQIYVSSDSGVTWTARLTFFNISWNSVAITADGSMIAGVIDSGSIYISHDLGHSWFVGGGNRAWKSIAASANGSKLAAVVYAGQIYTSTDSGASWTARESDRGWVSIASSDDGSKLLAAALGGQLYTSTDSGVTWTARESDRGWYAVASSSDGTVLAATVFGGQIYTSTDSGVTWTPRESIRNWTAVAASADGHRLLAGVNTGQLFTSQGPNGLVGDAGRTASLQYVGNGNWQPQIAAVPAPNNALRSGGNTFSGEQTFINGKVGIGAGALPAVKLQVTGDGPSWKGGAAFIGATNAVIMGELNGVAQIAGHSAALDAFTDLAINWGGNVAIGHLAPTEKLHVEGNILATGSVTANSFSGSGAGLTGLDAGNITGGTLALGQLPASLVTNQQAGLTLSGAFHGDGSGLTNLASRFGGNTFSGSQIFTNGSVGVGAGAHPAVKLHVTGAGPSWHGGAAFAGASNAVIMGELNGVAQIAGHSAALNAFTDLAINWGGNVAIGHLAPTEKLHVAGNILATGTVTASSFSGSAAGLTGLNASHITSGTFSGDGSGLTGVPGTIPWQTVAGTTQAAQPNTGYLLAHDDLSVVTLPASTNVGDLLTVSGAGAGGWEVRAVGGQIIVGGSLIPAGTTWTPRERPRTWRSVASSSDGTKLVAAAADSQIYTSTDSGATWTARDSDRNWWSVASSSDGTKLVAAVNGGQIYTSTDSGATWTARESNRNWYSVASSSDGTKLVAAAYDGQIYTSTDSGATWTARESNRNWLSVASSSDGIKLVAAVVGAQIYTSTDSGATWTARESNRNWFSVSSSSDGTKLVAAVNGGQIYTSNDSGATWTARESNRQWQSVSSSSDGTKLVAAVNGGQIYTSTDSGATWTARESNRAWQSVASSSNGGKLVAAALGYVYTSEAVSFLRGAPRSAATLQYVGGDEWLPLADASVASGVIGTDQLADGAVTAAKIGGTLDPSQIAGVALLNGGNAFTGHQTITNGFVGLGGPIHSAVQLHVTGNTPGSTAWRGAASFGNTNAALIMGEFGGRAHLGAHNGDLNAWADLVLNHGGNVGIGVLDPAAKLQVDGGILASGGVTAGSFSGSGASLTSLDASQLTIGAVPLARLPSGILTNQQTGVTLAGEFSGNGSGLTNLDLAPFNLATRSGGNSFSGDQIFTNGAVGIGGGALSAVKLRVTGEGTTWTGGAAFGGATSTVIMGELGGVAHLGAHSGALDAWADLVLNHGGSVAVGAILPTERLHVDGNILASGTITGSSDRNLKENFAPIHPREILDNVAAMPITRWNYKTDPGVAHVGPMAQDFHAAFSLGKDDKHISMVDADGVALAAIQGLNEIVKAQEARLLELEKANAALTSQLTELTASQKQSDERFAALEKLLIGLPRENVEPVFQARRNNTTGDRQ